MPRSPFQAHQTALVARRLRFGKVDFLDSAWQRPPTIVARIFLATNPPGVSEALVEIQTTAELCR